MKFCEFLRFNFMVLCCNRSISNAGSVVYLIDKSSANMSAAWNDLEGSGTRC